MRSKKPVEPVVYCGPDIPRVARSFTTYTEMPAALREMAEKCPAISVMTVPLSTMAETRRALKKSGTKEAIFYANILKYIQGGN